jgi:hypothetical protein
MIDGGRGRGAVMWSVFWEISMRERKTAAAYLYDWGGGGGEGGFED